MALIDNMVAHWKLDEVSGAAIDSHGSNHLSPINADPPGTIGKIGTGRQFGGGMAALGIGDNAALSMGDIDMTITFWTWRTGNAGSFPEVFGKDNKGGSREYGMYSSGSNSFRFYVFGTGGAFQECTPVSINIGEWVFVACFHSSISNYIAVSLNAGSILATSHSTGIRNAAASFVLGNADGDYTNSRYNGILDEFSVWKRLLSPSEITELYNGGNGLAYPFSTNEPVIRRFPNSVLNKRRRTILRR